MAIMSRVSRLLRADLHAVLDHLEEPDVLLRQAVREMEEALAGDTARARRLAMEHEQLARRAAELELSLAGIDAELDVCFEAGEHGLARSLCRRKLETARMLETVRRRHEAIGRDRDALETRINEQQLRFEAMRQKAELLAAEPEAPGEDAGDLGHVAADDVEVAFLREQRKRGGA